MRLSSLRGWLVPAAAGLLLAGCQGKSSSDSETASRTVIRDETVSTDTASVPTPKDGITAALLARHIKVLASDEFQGRRPFTVGEDKTTVAVAEVGLGG